jgi:hypothetical protein
VIFVVKDSELVESGTHEELLAAGKEYAELYKLQVTDVVLANSDAAPAEGAVVPEKVPVSKSEQSIPPNK